MNLPAKAQVIVAFGNSITDGTGTTINGDDRWPDVLSRRLHAAYGDAFVVVNQGIGGNRVVGPADYATKPIGGGPGALTRLERDIVEPARRHDGDLAGGHQRLRRGQRQRRGRHRRLQQGRRPSAPEDPGREDPRRAR